MMPTKLTMSMAGNNGVRALVRNALRNSTGSATLTWRDIPLPASTPRTNTFNGLGS